MNVVMTGGAAGLGFVAAQRISKMADYRLLLGDLEGTGDDTETLPLDLARLASVRAFAENVQKSLAGSSIDVLVLNAGTQLGNIDARSEDGFERTFAVNHLAHYLLLRLLLPHLADGATVVLTTSDTHDPSRNPLAPKELHPERLAHPEPKGRTGFIDGFRAYSASKLCNLLTACELSRSAVSSQNRWRVIAFNPGFTPGTSLFQNWPAWTRPLRPALAALRPVMQLATVEQAGRALSDLATGRTVPPDGRVYASLVRRRLTWPDPSDLAEQEDVMHDLWEHSANLVGLPASL